MPTMHKIAVAALAQVSVGAAKSTGLPPVEQSLEANYRERQRKLGGDGTSTSNPKLTLEAKGQTLSSRKQSLVCGSAAAELKKDIPSTIGTVRNVISQTQKASLVGTAELDKIKAGPNGGVIGKPWISITAMAEDCGTVMSMMGPFVPEIRAGMTVSEIGHLAKAIQGHLETVPESVGDAVERLDEAVNELHFVIAEVREMFGLPDDGMMGIFGDDKEVSEHVDEEERRD